MIEYEKAVGYRGGNIAVSASAGCGKTTTMIKRIEDIIIKEKINVSDLLVVTFTRAAAAEMKEKLKNTLIEYPPNSFEYKQIFSLDLADISTIHSFCSKVCREFFSIADIPPDFIVLEENDGIIYKNKVLDGVIKDYYEKNDSVFFELTQIFSYNRTDDGIIKTIDKLYNHIINIPNPEKFLEKEGLFCCEKDINKNKAINFLNKNLIECANCLIFDISSHIAICNKASQTNNIDFFEEIKKALTNINEYQSILQNAKALQDTLEILSKNISRQKTEDFYAKKVHERTKNIKTYIKKELTKMNEYFSFLNDKDLEKDLDLTKIYLEKICEITLEFYNRYKRFKKENALLDFNDLEHYTYKILCDNGSREILKNRYRYIFVDEFQDTNRIQDEIITQIEKNGNLFIVGDFKQSIYRFRGAENEIFKEKTENNSFKQITLGKNFRSDKDILNFINAVFSIVMKQSFSYINYSLNGLLKGELKYSMTDNRPPVIIDVLKEEEKQEIELKGIYSVKEHYKLEQNEYKTRATKEGKHIATEINKLINNKIKLNLNDIELQKRKAGGKDEYICYDDITVLVRAKKAFTNEIYNQLELAGIPVQAEFSKGANNYFEITRLITYLKLIDNFKQDIPLLSVLSSPFANFTEDEIAQIRIKYRKDNFYIAFENYINNENNDLAKRFFNFKQKTENYHLLSKSLPCTRLIMKIIKDSKYENYLKSFENGQELSSRLNNFLSIIYQKAYSKNITEFLYYIENMADEIKLGHKTQSQSNKVHLCTIHTSKGLEYPVVFIAGCGEKFSFLDKKQKLLINSKYGLAMDFYNYQNRTIKKSFAKKALSIISDYEEVKEEINTLYVAMTRAKYRLYVCGTIDLEKFEPQSQIYSIKTAKSYFDFILNVCMQDGKNYNKTDNILFFNKNFDLNYEFNVNIINEEKDIKKIQAKKEEIKKEITPFFDYKYIKSTVLPYKNTVTKLSKDITEDENLNDYFNIKNEQNLDKNSNMTDIGTIYHKILSLIDFNISQDKLPQYIQNLVEENILTKEEILNIDTKNINKILNLSIIKNAKNYYRELPFVHMINNKEAGGDIDEEILVQGIIDLLIIENGGAVIIDYKYSNKSNDYLKTRYSAQLNLYAKSVQKILGYKIIKKAIIKINTAEIIDID